MTTIIKHATGGAIRSSAWCHWKVPAFASRAEHGHSSGDGPCDRPAYGAPLSHHIVGDAMFVEIMLLFSCSRRALAKPGECEKYGRILDAMTASGATELVRTARNVRPA